MANPLTLPSDAQPGSLRNRSQMALDNLIRRELKVGDPNDADQIARALRSRYQNDTRAQAIAGEAQGLPFLQTPALQAPMTPTPTATHLDLEQARDDVDQDLRQLLTSNLTKDVRPELEGWQQNLHSLIDEGVAAAHQGLDPHSRDRAFAARRHLGEYARLARLIGALTPALNDDYRNLAQSLDEVSAVLLVLMGEAMANAGFAGGRYLLQVPYSELQARRDQVLMALRDLSGVGQVAIDADVYPWGRLAYRELYKKLEDQGQGELRSLLNESELARTLDELIHMSGGGSPLGMRRLGSTAWGQLARFSRFVQVTLDQGQSNAPTLLAFQDALILFSDGFADAGGSRLLRIARPSVLMYGLYGSSELTNAEKRLMQMVNLRGQFASSIDCITRCAYSEKLIYLQVILDLILFGLDRAIDLYAVGKTDLGLPEQRAAAQGYLIRAFLKSNETSNDQNTNQTLVTLPKQELERIENLLIPPTNTDTTTDKYWDSSSSGITNSELLRNELILQIQSDREWRRISEQMSSGCLPLGKIFDEPNEQRATNTGNQLNSRQQGLNDGYGKLMRIQHNAVRLIEDEDNTGGDSLLPKQPEAPAHLSFLPKQPEAPAHLEESLQRIEKRLNKIKIPNGTQTDKVEDAEDTSKEVASSPGNTDQTKGKTQPSQPVDHPPQPKK